MQSDQVTPFGIPDLEKARLFEPRHFPESAWLGHLPFACWLTSVLKPRVFVELGTHAGGSYFAFCQTIAAEGLPTKAFAVDTWMGDAQTGAYDSSVFASVAEHNARYYASFSTLMRQSFDAALPVFSDASIDLLHIDGCHDYVYVRRDFEAWLPKMSDRGVVLMHDSAVSEPGYGVSRFFREISTNYRTFSFEHCYGLAVLAVGKNIPDQLKFILGPAASFRQRQVFAQTFEKMGDRLVSRKLLELQGAGAAQESKLSSPTPGEAAEGVGKSTEATRRSEINSLWSRAAEAYARRGWLGVSEGVSDWLGRKRVALRLKVSSLSRRGPAGNKQAEGVLIFSGEPNTPGHVFRVERLAHSLESAGRPCLISQDLREAESSVANGLFAVLWVWRAPHSLQLESLMLKARASGLTVLYDCDDLMIDPDLAVPEIIDGIRSGNYDREAVASHYERVRRAMLLAEGLTAPTRPLIRAMREHFRPAFVLPNTFDTSTHDLSAQVFLRRQKENPEQQIVRIGYASGTLTHQKDFLQAAAAMSACLKENPRVRLVLFKAPGRPTLDISEFPQFSGLEKQIEWRDFVSMDELPAEMGRFDINIAPLETGNPYVEAKSELKYFDAALARVPTVASPTHPYQTAIEHGYNGFLAETPEEWKKCLQDLVSDKKLRDETGRRAYFHAIAKYGPLAKARSARRIISMMRGSPHDVATNFQAELMRDGRRWSMPICSDADLVWEHWDGRCARAAVVMPLYNYRDVVTEALDSVFAQTVTELELVVVDDASTDDSLRVVGDWMKKNGERFCRAVLLKNCSNSGLGRTRNRAIAEACALNVLPLDADNKLDPKCVELLAKALQTSDAAVAYPLIKHFGDSRAQMGYHDWHPLLFSCQNYVDAMAMISKSAWSDVGGYDSERTGWEDYDFNCRLVEAGYWGQSVPSAQAFYRVHGQSMVRTLTEHDDNRKRIADRYRQAHPWLDIARY